MSIFKIFKIFEIYFRIQIRSLFISYRKKNTLTTTCIFFTKSYVTVSITASLDYFKPQPLETHNFGTTSPKLKIFFSGISEKFSIKWSIAFL